MDFTPLDTLPLDSILIKIDFFSFTANNATYAALGDSYKYWNFYPTRDAASFGSIPVWGYGTVIQSNTNIKQGEHIFGYFPPSRFVVFNPIKINPDNFIVSRPDLPQDRLVYNTYIRTNHSYSFKSLVGYEDVISVFWPLFATGYYLADMITCKNFKVDKIIVTSASSKTAMSFAYSFKLFGNKQPLIALTSHQNLDFVKSLKLYDQVFSYNQVKEISGSCIITDFAGNQDLNTSLEKHLGKNRHHTISVGMSHFNPNSKLVGFDKEIDSNKRSEIFFAPSFVQQRYRELGKDVAKKREDDDWIRVVPVAKHWIKMEKVFGVEGALDVVRLVIDGKGDPKVGYVLSML